ncbi:ParB/RepB/Spo0J family partition protein [Dietzia maris]|uniref:ParB/RepB/Spo0J family partition protein n=1 Tax=Dietzia maris TaxID=37915 RepID=UPI0037C9943D
MKLIEVDPETLHLSEDLLRTSSAKSFEERLRSSIEEIGLAEPLKIAVRPGGGYVVIDGALRLRAVREIRAKNPRAFEKVPAYVLSYDRRFELRFQSDIYQDLLPSQLAALVEHLHESEQILKADIARFIGVSPSTLRNYTGLWRLMERGGYFARIVELMDVGVLPSSNPYAWLRLTDEGLKKVLREHLSGDNDIDRWVRISIGDARLGRGQKYSLKYVESVTSDLPPECYRVGQDVRAAKKNLGLRRGAKRPQVETLIPATERLGIVATQATEPVLLKAANSLKDYLT